MAYYAIIDKSDTSYLAKDNQLCIYADEEIAKSVLAVYQARYGRSDCEVRKVTLFTNPTKRDSKKTKSIIKNYTSWKRG